MSASIDTNKTGWRQPEYSGITYRDPKLYCFDQSQIIVIERWPSLRCWHKSNAGLWRTWTPHGFGLDTLPHRFVRFQSARNQEKVRQFWGNLPKRVRTQLEKYPAEHFSLAWLFARGGKRALELSVSNPLLAQALGMCRMYRPDLKGCHWPRTIRKMLKKKQRGILAWLGSPVHTEAAVKAMKKVPFSAMQNKYLLRELIAAIESPHKAKTIWHLPRINAGVITLLNSPAFPYLTHAFLEETALDKSNDSESQDSQAIEDICRMMEFLELGNPPQIRSRKDIYDLHNSLMDEYLKKQEKLKKVPFPSPPVPGTNKIIPITNGKALQEEARLMENCVFSYGPAVRAGRCFIYHAIVDTEHATIELRRNDQGKWLLAQVEGAENGKCRTQAMEAIQRWTREHGIASWNEERQLPPRLMFNDDFLGIDLPETIPF